MQPAPLLHEPASSTCLPSFVNLFTNESPRHHHGSVVEGHLAWNEAGCDYGPPIAISLDNVQTSGWLRYRLQPGFMGLSSRRTPTKE
jgi:hypothetical protein